MQCVECGTPMSLGDATCSNGHQYKVIDDVHRYLKPAFAAHFDKWLECLHDYRPEMAEPMQQPKYFNALPKTNAPELKRLWKLRAFELDFIRKTLGQRTGLKVLEVGAWIGWLSNRLTQDGQHVVGIDYFVNDYDGMAAKKHYDNSDWHTIQLDAEAPEIIEEQFDVVIFNHNVPYFVDLDKTMAAYKAKLKPGGIFFIIGLNIVKDAAAIENSYAEHSRKFKEKYGIEFQFKPTKVCIDHNDKELLLKHGFELVREPRMRLNNLKNSLDPKKPQYYHGIFRK
jgi:2-polyprenyl-3-methyl-5-hydroxy-6-metoxy-1,4-benzoquinol methylase